MSTRRLSLSQLRAFVALAALLTGAALLPATAAAKLPAGEVNPWKSDAPVTQRGKTFLTPSGGQACEYATYSKPTLVCEVRYREGIEGLPSVSGAKMPKFCREDFSSEWGNGVSLARKGRAQPACASGVLVLDQDPPQLEAGTRWRRGRYLCLAETTSVTCTTKTGAHGFRVDDGELRVW